MVGEKIIAISLLSLTCVFCLDSYSLDVNPAYFDSVSCPQYKCKQESQDFTSSTCGIYEEDNNIYYLDPCNSGYTCQEGQTPTANFTCQATIDYKYPGEICYSNSDCITGICNNRVCLGRSKEDDCKEDSDCEAGLFCLHNLICYPLLPAGSKCTKNTECVYTNYCDIPEDSTTGTCTSYFSKKSGTIVPKCLNPYFDYQCETGYCITQTDSETGKTISLCSEYYILKNDPTIPCTSNADCIGEDAKSSSTITTECTCGYNPSGNAYCQLLPGNTPYSNYLTLLKSWYESGLYSNCNTARRGSLACMSTYWNWDDYISLAYYKSLTISWPRIQEASDCILDTLEQDYKKAKIIYDAYSVTCERYECNQDSHLFKDSTCLYKGDDGTNYLKPCDSGYVCVSDFSPSTNYTCIQDIIINLAFPGEKCNKDSDCYTEYCDYGICEGADKDDSCKYNIDCSPGYYCYFSQCTDLLAEGDDCSNDSECNYDCYCHFEPNANRGTCTYYFSHEIGTELNSCYDGYIEYSCKTGYCIKSSSRITLKESYYCGDEYALENPSAACTTSSECLGNLPYSSDTIHSECSCGYNSKGNGYCGLLPGNDPYAKYIHYMKKWVDSEKARNCNTDRRNAFECMETHWDSDSFLSLEYYAYKTMLWPQIQDAEDCTLQIFVRDYWQAEYNYEHQDEFDAKALEITITAILSLLIII